MRFDIFFSICQTRVDGVMPDEPTMLRNFFDQVAVADRLGVGCAWMAESHLSCQTQKKNPGAVIPHFEGEIAVNVDFLQLATRVFQRTERIHCGSAIMNILGNGGPIAAAERVRAFLLLHGLDPNEQRLLEVGFAAGRFPFIYAPYGVVPRNAVESAAWHAVINHTFEEAVEIFLRLLRGEELSSADLTPRILRRSDVRTDADWERVIAAHGSPTEAIVLAPRWVFPLLKIIPQDVDIRKHLRLTIGSHYPPTQEFANSFLPCG
ncbi:MAG: luciferase, partial [bacterium]